MAIDVQLVTSIVRRVCIIQPIFKEYIKFLCDNGIKLPIQEGTYWLDNQIVKAYGKDGRLYYLYRLKINDDLTMTCKQHPDFKHTKGVEFETWQDTIQRNHTNMFLNELCSLALLQKYGKDTDRKIIDLNSTGKDSIVKTDLAKRAGLNFDTYFNVTTLDVAESNLMAKEQGYNFIYPDLQKYGGFYQWREKENMVPSRLNRCCCKYFKEDATINRFNSKDKLLFLFGMRNDESLSRSDYKDVWCNKKWGKKRDWIGLLPIRKWSELDIWLYILKYNLPINMKYKYGYSRVGCGIACPNYSKTTWVLDKYWYPKMYQRWQKILATDFVKNYKWLIMNCTLNEYIQKAWTGGTYRNEPTPETIHEFASYKGISDELAKNYFCHSCEECGKRIKDKDELAMNMKFISRDTQEFYCKEHLSQVLGIDEKKYNELIKNCKLQGCQLF